MDNVKVIFVEDYTKMCKDEFAEYIKKIYNEGYNDGYNKGKEDGSPITMWPSNIKPWQLTDKGPNDLNPYVTWKAPDYTTTGTLPVSNTTYTTTNAVSNKEV